jgi:biopolymer transport protein ExbD
VIVPEKGPALIDGEPAINDDAVSASAKRAFARDPDVRAVLNADGAVPHRRVIHLLDLLKRAGIVHVAFGALPPDQATR